MADYAEVGNSFIKGFSGMDEFLRGREELKLKKAQLVRQQILEALKSRMDLAKLAKDNPESALSTLQDPDQLAGLGLDQTAASGYANQANNEIARRLRRNQTNAAIASGQLPSSFNPTDVEGLTTQQVIDLRKLQDKNRQDKIMSTFWGSVGDLLNKNQTNGVLRPEDIDTLGTSAVMALPPEDRHIAQSALNDIGGFSKNVSGYLPANQREKVVKSQAITAILDAVDSGKMPERTAMRKLAPYLSGGIDELKTYLPEEVMSHEVMGEALKEFAKKANVAPGTAAGGLSQTQTPIIPQVPRRLPGRQFGPFQAPQEQQVGNTATPVKTNAQILAEQSASTAGLEQTAKEDTPQGRAKTGEIVANTERVKEQTKLTKARTDMTDLEREILSYEKDPSQQTVKRVSQLAQALNNFETARIFARSPEDQVNLEKLQGLLRKAMEIVAAPPPVPKPKPAPVPASSVGSASADDVRRRYNLPSAK